jgi:hypothetical protein
MYIARSVICFFLYFCKNANKTKEVNIDVRNHRGPFPDLRKNRLFSLPKGYRHHREYAAPKKSKGLYDP